MRTAALAIPLLFSLSQRVLADEARVGDYAFSIGGRALEPLLVYLNGVEGKPKPGDVAVVDGFRLLLGREKRLRLHRLPDDQGLEIGSATGPRWPVALAVRPRYWDGEYLGLENPLSGLSREQREHLMGVRLEAWTTDIAREVGQLDLSRVCVTMELADGPGEISPPLPPGLRCLSVDGLASLRGLSSQGGLEHLEYRGVLEGDGDLRPLAGLTHLKSLEINVLPGVGGREVANTRTLAGLRRLRRLDLRWCRGLADLSFASRLDHLEELILAGSDASDLAPLGRLPRLGRVEADTAPVKRLPEGRCRRLRELRVMSTLLDDQAVAAFRKGHPRVQVWHRWNDALRVSLDGVDRLRIRSFAPDRGEWWPLYDETDPKAIQQVVDWLEVEEPDQRWLCGCLGDPRLDFLRAGKTLATVGLHHGRSVRWAWPGDAVLQPQNAQALVSWLAAHGVTGPKEEIERSRRQAQADERKTARLTQGMSARLSKALLEEVRGMVSFVPAKATGASGTTPAEATEASEESGLAAALSDEYPDPADRIAVLLGILGTDNGSWTRLDWAEQTAERLLKGFQRDVLASACEAALSGNDRRRRRGAARLWLGWESPLAEWRPANDAALRMVVLDVMQEARYVPLRVRAGELIGEWAPTLEPEAVDLRLEASLADPAPAVRRRAMLTAGQLGRLRFELPLLETLAGGRMETRPLPPVPADEEVDVDPDSEDVVGGASDTEVAALALGYSQSEKARSTIRKMLDETASPTARVAQALYGEGQLLEAADFQRPDRSLELQMAAVASVVRNGGRHGLAWAIDYQQAHFGWEPDWVLTQLKSMLLANNAPGPAEIESAHSLRELREWHGRHGAEYLRGLSDPR